MESRRTIGVAPTDYTLYYPLVSGVLALKRPTAVTIATVGLGLPSIPRAQHFVRHYPGAIVGFQTPERGGVEFGCADCVGDYWHSGLLEDGSWFGISPYLAPTWRKGRNALHCTSLLCFSAFPQFPSVCGDDTYIRLFIYFLIHFTHSHSFACTSLNLRWNWIRSKVRVRNNSWVSLSLLNLKYFMKLAIHTHTHTHTHTHARARAYPNIPLSH